MVAPTHHNHPPAPGTHRPARRHRSGTIYLPAVLKKYYYAKADKYEDEIWHYLLSPSLWKDLLDAITVPTQNIPDIIAKLSLLEYEELVEIFDVLHNEKNKSNLILKKYEIK